MARLSYRLRIPFDLAYDYWAVRGYWSQPDVEELKATIDGLGSYWPGAVPPGRHRRLYTALSEPYVLLTDDEMDEARSRYAERAVPFKQKMLFYTQDGFGHSPYIAFPADRREHWSDRDRDSLIAVSAGCGYIDLVTPSGTQRYVTSSPRDSSTRDAHQETGVCPECLIALPATGVCDTCGDL